MDEISITSKVAKIVLKFTPNTITRVNLTHWLELTDIEAKTALMPIVDEICLSELKLRLLAIKNLSD